MKKIALLAVALFLGWHLTRRGKRHTRRGPQGLQGLFQATVSLILPSRSSPMVTMRLV
jgi:hypothetical protein